MNLKINTSISTHWASLPITTVWLQWYCDDRENYCNKLPDWDNIMTSLHLSAKETPCNSATHPRPPNLIQRQSAWKCSQCFPRTEQDGSICVPPLKQSVTFCPINRLEMLWGLSQTDYKEAWHQSDTWKLMFRKMSFSLWLQSNLHIRQSKTPSAFVAAHQKPQPPTTNSYTQKYCSSDIYLHTHTCVHKHWAAQMKFRIS